MPDSSSGSYRSWRERLLWDVPYWLILAFFAVITGFGLSVVIVALVRRFL